MRRGGTVRTISVSWWWDWDVRSLVLIPLGQWQPAPALDIYNVD